MNSIEEILPDFSRQEETTADNEPNLIVPICCPTIGFFFCGYFWFNQAAKI